MIRILELDSQYLENNKSNFSKIQSLISEGLKQPVDLFESDSKKKRSENIIKALRNYYEDIKVLILIPGVLIQILFPQLEIIINCYFLIRDNQELIKLEIIRLNYYE